MFFVHFCNLTRLIFFHNNQTLHETMGPICQLPRFITGKYDTNTMSVTNVLHAFSMMAIPLSVEIRDYIFRTGPCSL